MNKFVTLLLCFFCLNATAEPHTIPVRGDANAPVTITMFGDFECPYTLRTAGVLAELLKQMPSEVKIAYRNYPLEFHPNAFLAARSSVCAHAQGKFWETYDAFFAVKSGDLNPSLIDKIANDIGLNKASYDYCMQDPASKDRVNSDISQGTQIGVNGTPYLILVGPSRVKHVSGSYSLDDMKSFVKEVL